MKICEAVDICKGYKECYHSKPHEEVPYCTYKMICSIARKRVICKEISE